MRGEAVADGDRHRLNLIFLELILPYLHSFIRPPQRLFPLLFILPRLWSVYFRRVVLGAQQFHAALSLAWLFGVRRSHLPGTAIAQQSSFLPT